MFYIIKVICNIRLDSFKEIMSRTYSDIPTLVLETFSAAGPSPVSSPASKGPPAQRVYKYFVLTVCCEHAGLLQSNALYPGYDLKNNAQLISCIIFILMWVNWTVFNSIQFSLFI
ncbi:hypothetical protein GOODEAATRI_017410 [Goodea atripinnis]|uniref:Uncharacterized protein n=1 Tax=Goodea atripinnis TaxID=208336 RepID=A0ABV0MIY3_9TELE